MRASTSTHHFEGDTIRVETKWGDLILMENPVMNRELGIGIVVREKVSNEGLIRPEFVIHPFYHKHIS